MFLLRMSVTLERSAKLHSAWSRADVCLQSFGFTATCKVVFSSHTSHHHAHVPRFFRVKINFLTSPSGKNAQSSYTKIFFLVFSSILYNSRSHDIYYSQQISFFALQYGF